MANYGCGVRETRQAVNGLVPFNENFVDNFELGYEPVRSTSRDVRRDVRRDTRDTRRSTRRAARDVRRGTTTTGGAVRMPENYYGLPEVGYSASGDVVAPFSGGRDTSNVEPFAESTTSDADRLARVEKRMDDLERRIQDMREKKNARAAATASAPASAPPSTANTFSGAPAANRAPATNGAPATNASMYGPLPIYFQ